MKQMVATNEGHCKEDRPMMERPLVHPPCIACRNRPKIHHDHQTNSLVETGMTS